MWIEAIRLVKRQRTKSMFADRVGKSEQMKLTMNDMHIEIAERFSYHNRGLKPVRQRQIAEPMPKQLTIFEKIHEEIKAKVQAKNAKK